MKPETICHKLTESNLHCNIYWVLAIFQALCLSALGYFRRRCCKESTYQCKRILGWIFRLGGSPRGGDSNPGPVLLPGESHGQRSLVGYSLGGCRVKHNWATKCTHTQTRAQAKCFTCLTLLNPQESYETTGSKHCYYTYFTEDENEA